MKLLGKGEPEKVMIQDEETEEPLSLEEIVENKDQHYHNHKMMMLILSQMDIKLHTLLENTLTLEGVVIQVIDILARSSLLKEKQITHELKTLQAAAKLAESNIKKLVELMQIEQAMRIGVIKLNKDKIKIPAENGKVEEKNNIAYG